MNTTLLMDKGRVTIPKSSRTRYGIGDGDALHFFETKSGAMVLMPSRQHTKKSLFEHLRQFADVELPARKAHCAPRV